MVKSSNKKSIEDLENQLLLKNKNLNEKYLEIETLLDLTNTINSLDCLLYTSPSPRDKTVSRMPSSA